MAERIYGIDVTACPRKPTGVGHYIYQLTRALTAQERQPDERLLVFGRSDQATRKELAGAHFIDCGEMTVPRRILWEQTRFPSILRHHRVTVVHSPNYTIPVLSSCKRVTTFHDLTCFLFPRRRQYWHSLFYRNVMRYTIRHADHVIAVSENTRRDIQRVLKVPGKNISVVYEGANEIYRSMSVGVVAGVKERFGITQRYFLFIGTIEPTKNIERLARSFIMFRNETRSDVQLVLAGKLGWGYEGVLELIQQAGAGNIRQIGYQDDDTLAALYNGATAFVYPSLYEGFGIPPLEAMSCGTPVLCSNTSSLPEVVGDAALMFDPLQEREIADAMRVIASDEAVRKRLVLAGFERVKELTWMNAARKVLDIYRSLV